MILVLVVFVSVAASFASVIEFFSLELVTPRFVLEACCLEVVVFPRVSSPKGSWGGVDDAARARLCWTEI